MSGLRKKTAVLLLAALIAAGPFSPRTAQARTAYVERNDTGPIESVTIALQSAMQIYQKYVLSNLANLKSIKGLADISESFGALEDIRKEINDMYGKLDISEMIKFDDITKDIGAEFDGILAGIGSGEDSFFDSLKGMFGFGSEKSVGIADIIMTGKIGGTSLAGGGKSLENVAEEKGLRGAAVEAVSRTGQAIDKIAETASSSSGSDMKDAVMSGYSYLLRAVPMIHPDIASAVAESAREGLNSYTDDEIGYFHTFFADASKAAPLASVMELLDRHMDEDSPYSDKKYKEEITEEIKKMAEELEDIAPDSLIEPESPETKTTRLMGVIVRQNELIMRQYEVLAAAYADGVKMEAVKAGLRTSHMSDCITKNTVSRAAYFNRADKTAKKKWLDSIGVDMEADR